MDKITQFIAAIEDVKSKHGSIYFKRPGLHAVLNDLANVDTKFFHVLKKADEFSLFSKLSELQTETEAHRVLLVAQFRHDFVDNSGLDPLYAEVAFDSYLFGLELKASFHGEDYKRQSHDPIGILTDLIEMSLIDDRLEKNEIENIYQKGLKQGITEDDILKKLVETIDKHQLKPLGFYEDINIKEKSTLLRFDWVSEDIFEEERKKSENRSFSEPKHVDSIDVDDALASPVMQTDTTADDLDTVQVSSNSSNVGRKFYRDPDNRVIFGICSGMTHYVGLNNRFWVRLLFIVATYLTGGIGLAAYIILYFVVPEAKTDADKLLMRGGVPNSGHAQKQTRGNVSKIVKFFLYWMLLSIVVTLIYLATRGSDLFSFVMPDTNIAVPADCIDAEEERLLALKQQVASLVESGQLDDARTVLGKMSWRCSSDGTDAGILEVYKTKWDSTWAECEETIKRKESALQKPTNDDERLSERLLSELLYSMPVPDLTSINQKYVIEDPDGYTNVRDVPGGSIVAVVYDGDEFEVVEKSGDWWVVKLDSGMYGFMHKSRIVKSKTTGADTNTTKITTLVSLSNDVDKLQYDGEILFSRAWVDDNGENLILFTSTDEELYAFHYASKDEDTRLLRRVYDFEKGCDLELTLGFIEESIEITDLDRDNIGEITFAYKKACRSDFSPMTLKLLTLEDGDKYIIRGTTIIVYPDYSVGGEKLVDPSFIEGPEVFLSNANQVWERIVRSSDVISFD